MKKIFTGLLAAFLLVTVTACSSGEQDWNGTFYNYLDENHILAFTFEHDTGGESLVGREIEITTNSGFSRSSVGVSAWIKKEDVAEDDRGYRYTLKGDTLTVKYTDDGEVFGTDFSGAYKRGASVEETFDLADEADSVSSLEENGDADSGLEISIAFNEFYYRDGDVDDITFYFREDGTVDKDNPDSRSSEGQTFEYKYTVRDGQISIETDGSEFTLTIVDSFTLEATDGIKYIRMGDTDEPADGASDTDTLWSGIFTSEDGAAALMLIDFDGQSFKYGFVSNDDDDDGLATLSSAEAAEAEGLTFWFMDKDTLLVSGGSFEGMYARNPEDSDGSSGPDKPSLDSPRITGVFHPNGEDSGDTLTFYDDYTGSWYNNKFEFEIVGDSILFKINGVNLEIQIRDDNTLYWELYDSVYKRAI